MVHTMVSHSQLQADRQRDRRGMDVRMKKFINRDKKNVWIVLGFRYKASPARPYSTAKAREVREYLKKRGAYNEDNSNKRV